MPSQNGLFGTSGLSSTGTSRDLNGDHNLDLGSTVNTSVIGWCNWCTDAGTYVTAAAAANSYANVLLGEIAYSYTANATGTQTSTVNILPRVNAGALTNMLDYELNGGANSFDTFYGTHSTDVAVGLAPTITVTPVVGTLGLSLSGSLAASRIMVNAADALTFTVTNTGAAPASGGNLTTNATRGTITPSSSTYGSLMPSGSASVSMSYSSANAGTFSIGGTASDTGDSRVSFAPCDAQRSTWSATGR